ncbi:receptor like protein kinase S.2 [Aegilops tauschii subsp. strangulata]|uniref:Protein kinase domain-containing protein n=2 Tax=Aegilops tauschii TaxID=37682 RepID=A0A453M4F7_AEGTS|nr:uncharacterized protein LOC109763448 [Aegilops tauschii subsp. strangulata]XP_020177885.1 uncharacterized protein LOC109763448 [Aegilops tauschii subsp. strangulata]
MDLRESTVTEMIQGDDRSKWLSYSNHNIKCFAEGEIRGITSNYETIIGKGGFGEVYKGVLQDGRIVAIKKFMCNVEENFAKELKVHCEINHKNVVRLIGYCAEENALMIVSEYISQGNLCDVLHHKCIPITLDTRLRIAVECSEALCYMHSQMYTQVIHGDIKPANILLDDQFNAKISDFGISRLVNTDSALFTEHVIGSIGYMDPLFARSGRLTSKSDVYSFGIVLVELITKKKATLRNGETGIVECFAQALAAGKRRVRELFDVEISSQNNMKVLEGVAKLAGQCLMMEIDRRPDMIDVAERLRALRKTQVQGKQTIFPWGWRNKPAVCRHFSLGEMKSATSNFDESHLVGRDGYGSVYYGMIDGGATKVAIKPVEQDVSEFQTEIAMMAKLRHHHLVSLVGYCHEKNQRILIYDYMVRGALSGNLYANNTKEPPLTWRQRLDICIGAARALHYLHECSIIHNDVSTTNILLDDRLVGKFSSKVSRRRDTMDVTPILRKGNFYCADPEFRRTGEFTEKSNVYSFGVVLFEVLCARAAWDPSLPRRQVYLVQCALNCQKKDILDLIVDPYLEEKIAPLCFKKFVEIAEKCVSDHAIHRPTMQEVLENLELCACLAEQSGSLGDETPDDVDTDGPSRRECRLNLEMYLAEDDDSSYCSEIPTSEDDGIDGDEQIADSMDSKLSIDSNLCHHFSLREMKSATRNFDESHLVCVGGSRDVYYGVIDGAATKVSKLASRGKVCVGGSHEVYYGMMVAIKRDKVVQDASKFLTEIATMAKLRHHHLVSLVGYCKEENEMILIDEYMARGTLFGNLYGNSTEQPPLTWRQRLDICIGAARALHYLHEHSFTHNDVSTASILLDWRLVGKVSIKVSLPQDATDVTTRQCPMARFSFLDSETCCTWQLTAKSNVYSFGVVLFEVLCARAAYDPNLPWRQANLVEYALSCQKKGIIDLIVDPYLKGNISPWCFKKFVEIAEKCVSDCGVNHPTMQEVLQDLEMCLAEQNGSPGDEMLADDDSNGSQGSDRCLKNDGIDGDELVVNPVESKQKKS